MRGQDFAKVTLEPPRGKLYLFTSALSIHCTRSAEAPAMLILLVSKNDWVVPNSQCRCWYTSTFSYISSGQKGNHVAAEQLRSRGSIGHREYVPTVAGRCQPCRPQRNLWVYDEAISLVYLAEYLQGLFQDLA